MARGLLSPAVALTRAKLIPTGFFPKVLTTRLLGLLPWWKAMALIAAGERLAGRILIDTEVLMARSKFRRAPRLENLESRELLSTVSSSEAPSSHAQYMLQVLNMVRTNPQAAVQYLESNITPDITATLKYYGVNLSATLQPDRLDAGPAAAGMERRSSPRRRRPIARTWRPTGTRRTPARTARRRRNGSRRRAIPIRPAPARTSTPTPARSIRRWRRSCSTGASRTPAIAPTSCSRTSRPRTPIATSASGS